MDGVQWGIVAAIVFMLVMIPVAIYQTNKFDDACHAKGGKTLHTKGGLYCLKPDAIIKVN